jgi:hypothetical protein
MKARIENGKLIIEIDAETQNPRPSATGKTRIVATTSGNMATTVMVQGKPLVIGLNAYIKN